MVIRLRVLPGIFLLAAVLWTGAARAEKAKVDPIDAYFASGLLPRLHIEADPAELRGLDANPKTYIRAQIRESAPGEAEHVYRDVGMHL
jgi:hypothetical protein